MEFLLNEFSKTLKKTLTTAIAVVGVFASRVVVSGPVEFLVCGCASHFQSNTCVEEK